MRYKTEIDNVSKFCVAPFMSLNVDPDGSVKSCCMQDPQHIGVKYSDHDNMHSLFADSEFNNLRTMMRQNIEHPSCTTCYRNEDSGIESERQIRNRDYIRNYENIKITDTSIPAFSIAPLIAVAPNLVADTDDKLPPKLPIGVRTADTITTSFIICFFYEFRFGVNLCKLYLFSLLILIHL